MRALLLLAGAMFVALDASAQEAVSVSVPKGMVEQPCPDMPAKPVGQQAIDEAFLAPGRPDISQLLPRLTALSAQPEVQAYQAAKAALDAQDWAGLCRYRQDNARLIADGVRPDIVFMGDSITENWVLADPDFFSDRVVGRGIGGQTTAQMLVRFTADVVALNPRAVQIMAGTNDVAGNGGPTTVGAYRNNIMAMADIARVHGIRVILASIPPARRFIWQPDVHPAEQIVILNDWLRDYAAREGLLFVDYYSALATPEGGLRAEMALDGVHPNRDGYALMKARAPIDR